ncbi:RDD family protein [Mycobacterium hubeiense]|uniref:RDD family protein n=1 Tax=Mycobacterium hubeiense TaxID=1867256 RepID=UPI000C7EAA74|nr:RDD family protein [Mycobacterium sp. QGD 101]
MTAVLDTNADVAAGDSQSTEVLASWGARAGAFAVDVLVGLAVLVTLALSALTAPQQGWLWWVFTAGAAATVVAMAVNRWLLPSMTGWSLGRALFGIRVVRRDGADAGVFRLMLRDVAHVLDTLAIFVGWLWPLWDRRRRTFADLLVRTEVLSVPRPERDMRRPVGWVLVAATLVCAGAVALGYLAVYRQDQAVDAARSQIAEEGPRIVEQMLSYNADTIEDDFKRAQELATDNYREQLAAQQAAVRKAGPTNNEYWAVSSAVLSASENQAAMLMAMQGQRGANAKDLKFITATVRVDFDKSADGKWRVANLTVLKSPQLQEAGQ